MINSVFKCIHNGNDQIRPYFMHIKQCLSVKILLTLRVEYLFVHEYRLRPRIVIRCIYDFIPEAMDLICPLCLGRGPDLSAFYECQR